MRIATFETVEGVIVDFFVAERRRYYGRQTLTWVFCEVDGVRQENIANDPWPAVTFPIAQLLWEARAAGLNVPPNKSAIKWAKRLEKEGRFFCMSAKDRERYLAVRPSP